MLQCVIQHNLGQKTLVTLGFESIWGPLGHWKSSIFLSLLCMHNVNGDAQDCQFYTPMLRYDRNEISNSVVVMHLVAPINMVGPLT